MSPQNAFHENSATDDFLGLMLAASVDDEQVQATTIESVGTEA